MKNQFTDTALETTYTRVQGKVKKCDLMRSYFETIIHLVKLVLESTTLLSLSSSTVFSSAVTFFILLRLFFFTSLISSAFLSAPSCSGQARPSVFPYTPYIMEHYLLFASTPLICPDIISQLVSYITYWAQRPVMWQVLIVTPIVKLVKHLD